MGLFNRRPKTRAEDPPKPGLDATVRMVGDRFYVEFEMNRENLERAIQMFEFAEIKLTAEGYPGQGLNHGKFKKAFERAKQLDGVTYG